MKIIKHKTDLPTPCKTCRKLRQTIRIPVYHCALRLHFPTVKNTCKREDMKAGTLFKKFLKDNGILEAYCQNYDKEKLGTIIKDPWSFIDSVFKWDYTEQGGNFWCIINYKWKRVLAQRKTK